MATSTGHYGDQHGPNHGSLVLISFVVVLSFALPQTQCVMTAKTITIPTHSPAFCTGSFSHKYEPAMPIKTRRLLNDP